MSFSLSFFVGVGGFLLFVIWGLLLLGLSSSRYDRRILFYLIGFLPFGISVFGFVSDLFSSVGLWFVGVLILMLFYWLGWLGTLYSVGGEKRIGWFFLILFFSPLWIFYMVGESFG